MMKCSRCMTADGDKQGGNGMKKPIICPVCSKGKFYPVRHPRGAISIKCEKCHQPILIDWDTGRADKGNVIKYAS